jgi:hypothetical protein
MVNNILKIQHCIPTLLRNNPISKYNMSAHQPHFAGCQKNPEPGKSSQKEMKFGRMIGCGFERPKQAPATMLPDEKQCYQGTQSPGLPITTSHTTTFIILPKYHLVHSTAS